MTADAEHVKSWNFSSVCVNHPQQGTVWSADITLATRIVKNPLLVIRQHIKVNQWIFWDRNQSNQQVVACLDTRIPYFADGKANLQNPVWKRSKLLYQANAEMQYIFQNLVFSCSGECHIWKTCSLSTTPRTWWRCGLVHALTKKKRETLWFNRPEELGFAVRDQLLEKVPSQELQTKLFEVLNLQLAAASRPEHGKQHVIWIWLRTEKVY